MKKKIARKLRAKGNIAPNRFELLRQAREALEKSLLMNDGLGIVCRFDTREALHHIGELLIYYY